MTIEAEIKENDRPREEMVETFHVRVPGYPGFACNAGEAVLDAMERQGHDPVTVGCRRGGCGVCRVRVTSGNFRVGKMSRTHVSEEAQAEGLALACRLYPETDIELEAVPLERDDVKSAPSCAELTSPVLEGRPGKQTK